MVRREDISSRLQRIQESSSEAIPSAVAAVVAAPHINGLAAEMYNDPLLVAIALHFDEDDHEAAVEHSFNEDGHASDVSDAEQDTLESVPTVPIAEPIKTRQLLRRSAEQHARALRRRPKEVITDLPTRNGQKGTRRVRRAENDLNLLRSNTGNKELTDGPTARYEPVVSSRENSIFADLVDDTEAGEKNRKLWDQFLSLSEEKQQRVLRKIDNVNKYRGAGTSNKEKSEFAAIDRRLRQMLLRQKPPPFMVRQVEEVVISAFKQEPHSVQLYRKLDAFRRSLYHSVCQYAKLTSKTLHKGGGASSHSNNVVHADIEVRNLQKEFTCPAVMLSDYLEKSRDNLA